MCELDARIKSTTEMSAVCNRRIEFVIFTTIEHIPNVQPGNILINLRHGKFQDTQIWNDFSIQSFNTPKFNRKFESIFTFNKKLYRVMWKLSGRRVGKKELSFFE